MTHRKASLLVAAAATAVLLVGCSGGGGAATVSTARAAPPNPLAVRGPTVVTVGDIACAPGSTVTATKCRDAATARLAGSFRPALVLMLGDEQYDDGALADFGAAYARTWGRFMAITKPLPGNHEYDTSGASGYYGYFRQQTTPPGYYAFDVGSWRVYALNSNCSQIDCAAEATWLDGDMAAHPRACSAIAMHHPRYSSGAQHGDSPEVRPLWRVAVAHHADLALAGHDHEYERFHAMDGDGNVTGRGMVSFVVGTGGKSLYAKGRTHVGSVIFDNHLAGVLALRLGARRFGWQFRTVDGRVVDSGVRGCH